MTLTKLLAIRHPIIQAPMAGVTTPEFVAESAEAGVLGSVGAGYFSAEETRKFIRKVKKLTEKSFSVNLFVPEKVEFSEEHHQQAFQALQPFGDELGIQLNSASFTDSEFQGQIQVLIEEGVKICTFTFGLPDKETIRLLKANDILLIGTATTAEEAELGEQVGMDAIVVQGSEAGGHRGSFLGELKLVPLHELLNDVVKAVSIPIIAAGGIANKEMMDHALSMGAEAVQIGTALLATNESGANLMHKKALLHANKGDTVLTKAFTGKTARSLRNRFTEELTDAVILPYPYQAGVTNQIRKEAAKQGNKEFISLWAGENVHLITGGKIKEVIEQFI